MLKSKDKNHPAVLSLRDYQFRKKISREELAEQAGIGYGTLQKLMSGDIPTDATLRTIEANLGLHLIASYQMVSHPELGEYPKSWCDDLMGSYLSIRQNRWLDKGDVINTFPVTFSWCNEKPGLKMVWEFAIDPKHVKRQSAYVSMTSRDGGITIFSNNGGSISSTHLQREDEKSDRLFGIYCGYGQIGRGRKAIISQVVAYIRSKEIDFKHDNQVWPGASGHSKFLRLLCEIEGSYCYTLKPPGQM